MLLRVETKPTEARLSLMNLASVNLIAKLSHFRGFCHTPVHFYEMENFHIQSWRNSLPGNETSVEHTQTAFHHASCRLPLKYALTFIKETPRLKSLIWQNANKGGSSKQRQNGRTSTTSRAHWSCVLCFGTRKLPTLCRYLVLAFFRLCWLEGWVHKIRALFWRSTSVEGTCL